ncbi:MAG: peptidoglycan-associated lipoprotein [Candidatus Krumholzibacteriia bacterium]|jgi:peptidoglycan-associated lipoprotein
MYQGWLKRALTLVMAIVLMMGLTMFTGCGGGDPEVNTDAADGMEDQVVEELPVAPTPEEDTAVEETPDYAAMDPSEYGVQDIFFEFDEYELSNEAMAILAANARAMGTARVKILISGHCDERGTVEYNLALGEKRANAVRDYMVSLGVPAYGLQVTSYGENSPFAQGSNEDAWARNRRAHFERP